MSKTPTQGERAEFRAFCQAATTEQLKAIIEKEEAAERIAYADIARSELGWRTYGLSKEPKT